MRQYVRNASSLIFYIVIVIVILCNFSIRSSLSYLFGIGPRILFHIRSTILERLEYTSRYIRVLNVRVGVFNLVRV